MAVVNLVYGITFPLLALVLDAQTKLLAAQQGWQEADAEVANLVDRYNALDSLYQALLLDAGMSATNEADIADLLREVLDKFYSTS